MTREEAAVWCLKQHVVVLQEQLDKVLCHGKDCVGILRAGIKGRRDLWIIGVEKLGVKKDRIGDWRGVHWEIMRMYCMLSMEME